ncbi:MAG: formate dehydrogenase [Rubrivivax sp.]
MPDHKTTLARRTWLGGAATAGAAAAAVTLLPSAPKPKPTAQAAAPTVEPAAGPSGYQLTEHVKQYYASARI